MLTNSRTYDPFAHKARHDVSKIVAKGRTVHLFWVRAHGVFAGNERANKLARRAALITKTAADYDRFPLSYSKEINFNLYTAPDPGKREGGQTGASTPGGSFKGYQS
ncbi:hypothetical protein EVAR_56220_1 [Eumeta japonica]|uniref:RNase H type-1 domain-containing protein n=1 Tax=Eumeta variegata TaxID=151549 RepID=A0A4C1YVP7_EUMVA|nr:hypothetical protein EVAR_56220_1 [Eumeta japonica]